MTLDDTIGYMISLVERKINYEVDSMINEYDNQVEQLVEL